MNSKTKKLTIDGFVRSQNNDVPRGRGRYRRRYRTLTDDPFDPDADKAGMLLFTKPSQLKEKINETNKKNN